MFKDVTIIEIRPKHGTFSSELDALMFQASKIGDWMEQGYEDTKRIVGDTFDALDAVSQRISSEIQAEQSIDKLKKRQFKLV